MALMMECDECQHVQSVGIIENGLPGGYPNPHQKCEKCGTAGRYSAPGARKRLEEQMQGIVDAIPDPRVFDAQYRLEKLSPKDSS
ncbi:hypothetical protein A3F64_03085 [Candidatus Saccharibacteria bacterium RIFCSPHIGHO2_12_FULL_42_8]|nr:MAG: hypothetical protein A3F64_03085 [Candidatus Saccharibacteria bacterium RIFCSPHIGHO2_12_FULL_42_8]